MILAACLFSAIILSRYITTSLKIIILACHCSYMSLISALPFLGTGQLGKFYAYFWVKLQAQFVSNDPGYLNCMKKECQAYDDYGTCLVNTCTASLTFHVVNIRTDIEFVFFAGAFDRPCILTRSIPVSFANPKMPLYGHLSSIDSTGTSVSNHIYIMIRYWIWSLQCSILANGDLCRWD